MDLDELSMHAHERTPWAHLATADGGGEADVVPMHPCRDDDVIPATVRRTSYGMTGVECRSAAA